MKMTPQKTYSILFFLLTLLAYSQEKKNIIVPNENLITKNIPEIPTELSNQVKKYAEARGASLVAVNPVKNEIIINTRFSSTSQLHLVTQPLGMRSQITFFDEPVSNASYEPINGNYLIYSRDAGGNEFGQLYKLDTKTLVSTLLTDGERSQNGGVTWRKDGKGFYYSSTKRNGGDRDIYYMDPMNPASTKLILEVKGGGWWISDVSEDNKQMLIGEYVSANESHVWMLNIETGKLSEVTDRKKSSIIQSYPVFSNSPNEIWYITDNENEFERLATFNLKTKEVKYFTSEIPWNVEYYVLSEDKKSLVFVTNEAGRNKLYLMKSIKK